MFELLFYVFGFCFLIGVGYPLFSVLIYPLYRILGGKKKLNNYLRDL